MENSTGARAARRVRCPKCHSVLEEPGALVYQCGGCGTSLRAKNRTGSAGAVPAGSTAGSGMPLPPRSGPGDVASTSSGRQATDATSRHGGSGDVASTSSAPDAPTSSRRRGSDSTSRRESGDYLVSARSQGSGGGASTRSTPDATAASRRLQGSDTTSRRESGDYLVSARRQGSGDAASTSSTPDATAGSRRQGSDSTSRRESGDEKSNRVSEQVALIEKRVHDEGAAVAKPEARDAAGGAERGASSPRISAVQFSARSKAAASDDLQAGDSEEKRMKRLAESTTDDEARKKHSVEAAVQPQCRHRRREEPAPKSADQAAAAQPARDAQRREDDDAHDAPPAGEKAPSPSRQQVQAENLGPLRKKILQTVDELKGDLSELFSKSPELNPPRARPPRRPKQEGLPASARARHADAATGGHRGSAARVAKPAYVAAAAPPCGLPSRRYRQCRADPCCHNVQCHHGCCRHHGRPECSSCRGYCCRPRAQEPSPAPRKPPKEAKRRLPPRNHCRPVLKGAPFIVCSSCFKLVQVPADFAVATKAVRKLRCGSCSTVLSYSYRDPARKKAYEEDSVDRCSTDVSDELPQGDQGLPAHADPFAPFVDGFGLSSYSTVDEQPLHVSRNTSFDTIDDGTKGVGRLHRLMGYGSASELLLRHSPDLCESFSERTTPDVGQYDRKGKGVCIDDNDYDVDDSDEEDGGVFKGFAARGPGSGWPLPLMIGKGTPAPGAIRIK